MSSGRVLSGLHWMHGLFAESLQTEIPDRTSPGIWMKIVCAALCLLTLYLAVKVVARYYQYFDNESHPATESPTMFLLPWLATCDIITTLAIMITMLLGDNVCTTGGSGASTFFGTLERAALAAQMCYFLVHALLSVHIMSISYMVNRVFDTLASDYYGPVAGVVSFFLSYRLVTAHSAFPTLLLTVLPLGTFTLLALSAACATKASVKRSRVIRVHVDESGILKVRVNLVKYARFSRALAALCLLFHLPWLAWAHSWIQADWVSVLAQLAVCGRGVYLFAISSLSPAVSMQLVPEDEHEHEHKE
ncbi:hypothetical protein LPJ66_004551 [Kickxella alabastrina]|uniref:Uncharacterized protein n=1 Tax=Kickxella alabastrina TaxID=61397 RepID=A0ACC1IJB4_9FUNG|nr:hypothetical protein LPJ66_004551 [Kickxella alabastrina]